MGIDGGVVVSSAESIVDNCLARVPDTVTVGIDEFDFGILVECRLEAGGRPCHHRLSGVVRVVVIAVVDHGFSGGPDSIVVDVDKFDFGVDK